MKLLSARGLVAGFLENISSEVFDHYLDEITALIGRQHGVYALYRRGRLYYVGLATDLRGRVKYHLKDRHAKKWDTFSLYLITKAEHLRELETLVVHIAEPKGNIQAGKFASPKNLRQVLSRLMKDRDKAEHTKILQRRTHVAPHPKKKHRKAPRSPKGIPPMAGLTVPGRVLRAIYKKAPYTATVDPNGRIVLGDKVYNSPSAAGAAVRGGKATDGWKFWKYEAPDGKWAFIDGLRKSR